MAARKQKREKKRSTSQTPLQRLAPNDLKPPTKPHLLKVPPPSNSIKLRTKSLTHGSLRNIPEPNYRVNMHKIHFP
jgi:hypothetical protein